MGHSHIVTEYFLCDVNVAEVDAHEKDGSVAYIDTSVFSHYIMQLECLY